MTIRQLVLTGDSTVEGATGNCTYGLGGQGTWAQNVTDRLSNIVGLGPLVSSGCMCTTLSYNPWSFTTGGNAWTDTLSTDAWDKAPYGTSAGAGQLKYANGSAKVATWTANANIRYPNVGFAIYWVDYASGSISTPSYSVDGGTNWINFPDTPARNNTIRKFYVATPITSGSTVKIRGANAAATGVGVAPLGIEVFYQDPATASGLIVHNIAVYGSALHNLVTASSGDRMAWFDSVVLGTGAITNTPDLGVVMMHINDVSFVNNTTTWATDLTALYTRVHPLGPFGIINPYEANTASYNVTSQANYRAQSKTTGAGFGTPALVLDLYDPWNATGFGTNALASAQGLLATDLTHESQAGHIDIARRVYWWLRTKYLTSYTGSSTYTAAGTLTTVRYLGTRTAVQYSAAQPVGIVPV